MKFTSEAFKELGPKPLLGWNLLGWNLLGWNLLGWNLLGWNLTLHPEGVTISPISQQLPRVVIFSGDYTGKRFRPILICGAMKFLVSKQDVF